MKKYQLILSGVGGQGSISGATLLGKSATEHAGLYATQTSFYGSETRGTYTKADLVVCDEPISFPEVQKADLILCMHQIAYDRHYKSMPEGSILVYDSMEVSPSAECPAKQYGYDFTKLALDMGSIGAANMIALGVIVKLTGMLNPEAVKASISEHYAGKESYRKFNIMGFERGVELVNK